MINQKDLQFAKELAKHTNKWVALKVREQRIIASGKTLRDVQKQVEKQKAKNYAFHFVERYPLAM